MGSAGVCAPCFVGYAGSQLPDGLQVVYTPRFERAAERAAAIQRDSERGPDGSAPPAPRRRLYQSRVQGKPSKPSLAVRQYAMTTSCCSIVYSDAFPPHGPLRLAPGSCALGRLEGAGLFLDAAPVPLLTGSNTGPEQAPGPFLVLSVLTSAAIQAAFLFFRADAPGPASRAGAA